MSNGESKPVCPPKAQSMTDRERAEAIWNDRIGPTFQGFYTINRSGIIGEIERALAAVRADAAAHFASNLPAIEEAVRAEERERCTGIVRSEAHRLEKEGDEYDQLIVANLLSVAEELRRGDPQVETTSADKDAVYVTVKGTRHHFWRDEAEQVVRELKAALGADPQTNGTIGAIRVSPDVAPIDTVQAKLDAGLYGTPVGMPTSGNARLIVWLADCQRCGQAQEYDHETRCTAATEEERQKARERHAEEAELGAPRRESPSLQERYDCNTALLHARTKAMNDAHARVETVTKALRDLLSWAASHCYDCDGFKGGVAGGGEHEPDCAQAPAVAAAQAALDEVTS